MRTPNEVKLRANKLREILLGLGYSLKHADSLEAVSKLEGFHDWNTFSARLQSTASLATIPDNWFPAGSDHDAYELGCDPNEKYRGNASAIIRSKEECDHTDQSMATMMQTVEASEYLGQRVRLSAKIKATSVEGAVTIWFRVDGAGDAGKKGMLSFDNLEKHKRDGTLQGSTSWLVRSIVLDVPESAQSLNFGFYLRGTGVAHATDFTLERVGDDVSPSPHNEKSSTYPINLNFSKNKNQDGKNH